MKIQTMTRCTHYELNNVVIMIEYQLFKEVVCFKEARQNYQLTIYSTLELFSVFQLVVLVYDQELHSFCFHLFSFAKAIWGCA